MLAGRAQIAANQKAEMPFWLCKLLAAKNFVTPTLPAILGPRVQAALQVARCSSFLDTWRDRTSALLFGMQADAGGVNLYTRCPYFYDFALEFARLYALSVASLATPHPLWRQLCIMGLPQASASCHGARDTANPHPRTLATLPTPPPRIENTPQDRGS